MEGYACLCDYFVLKIVLLHGRPRPTQSLEELHMWALHYVYLLRINRSLAEFRAAWNSYPMRTTVHKSPHQLYFTECLLLQNSGIEISHKIFKIGITSRNFKSSAASMSCWPSC